MMLKELRRLFRYKDYIGYSSKVTLTSRYSNMYLGILWWFIDPLLLMGIYGFVYLVIFNVQTANYTVFILTGLVVWRWISNSVTQSSSSISSKVGILEQVAVPKQVFPLVTLLVETFLFFAAFILIAAALVIDNVSPTIHLVEIVPLTMVTFIWLYGIGLIVSHYGAFIADLQPAFSYGMRFLFFLSPIFYEISKLPQNLQGTYYLNPIIVIVEGYRSALIHGTSPNYLGLSVILLMGLAFIWFGLHLIHVHDKDYGRLK